MKSIAFRRITGLLLIAPTLSCAGEGAVDSGPEVPVAARIERVAGDAQTATVATSVPVAPAVKVTSASGAPVGGVAVTFSVTSGGGSVAGAAAVTNGSGVAAIGSWTLGTTAGANELSAMAAGLSSLIFRATGVAGPPASMVKHEGDVQTARAGSAVTTAPAVKVRDAHGNAVANASVTFSVASGGGSVTGASATTNAEGVARVGGWTLGTATSNTLTAALAGLPAITFSATALPAQYEGPLVETHAHIVNYRSLMPAEGVNYRVDARQGATTLTATSYVAGLDRNNIRCVVGFHAIALDGRQSELLAHARRLRSLYPDRFILLAEIFSENPLDWFDAARIDPIFNEGVFRGFGEIQFLNEPLGDGQSARVLPSHDRFLNIYDALGNRRLLVMAHPASLLGVMQAVARSSQLTWLMHGPQVHRRWTAMNELESLLNANANLYYTIDFSESLPEFLTITKVQQGATTSAGFLQAMNQNYSTYLDRMVAVWKDVIERHPDRFMWGTDMAFPTWHWEPPVLDMMVRFSRDFIARLTPTTAERFAYQNAERVFGPCQ